MWFEIKLSPPSPHRPPTPPHEVCTLRKSCDCNYQMWFFLACHRITYKECWDFLLCKAELPSCRMNEGRSIGLQKLFVLHMSLFVLRKVLWCRHGWWQQLLAMWQFAAHQCHTRYFYPFPIEMAKIIHELLTFESTAESTCWFPC